MLQKLPGDAGDDDGWARAGALFDTLTPASCWTAAATCCSTGCSTRTASSCWGHKPLGFACSCSRERVEAMLVSLGAEEAHAALADGEAVVRCEFCGQSYRFDQAQIESLFAGPGSGRATGSGKDAMMGLRRTAQIVK